MNDIELIGSLKSEIEQLKTEKEAAINRDQANSNFLVKQKGGLDHKLQTVNLALTLSQQDVKVLASRLDDAIMLLDRSMVIMADINNSYKELQEECGY